MKILITGGSGNLGTELKKIYPTAWAPSSKALNLKNLSSISKYLKTNIPDVVIHTAALTDVRKCEKEHDLAWKINVEGTENLFTVAISVNTGVSFVFISTAGVFSGEEGNYDEESVPYPQNFYCFTKSVAEQKLLTYMFFYPNNICVIRTNFVPKKKWQYPRAFIDRWGTYLFASDVAKGIKDVIDARLTGIVHICGDKKLSMFELAKFTTPDIKPVTLSEYNGVPLPKDISLVTKKWKTYSIGNTF